MNRLLLALIIILVVEISAYAQTSRNGDFVARIARNGVAKSKREHNTWTTHIVDRQGRTRYQIVKQVAFDVQYPAVYLSDDGSCILVSGFAGEIEFYDNAGNLRDILRPFGRATAEYEQVIKCSVAGERVAVLYSAPERAQAELLVRDLHGNELWRVALDGRNAGEVFLSNDGQVAVGSYEVERNNFHVTEIFDASGKALRIFNMLFRYSDIADGRIVLADRDNILLASLREGDPPVKWSRSSGDLITAVRFVDGFVALIVESLNLPKGSPVYSNPSLVVLNRKGKEVARTQLRTSSTSPAALSVETTHLIVTSSSSSASIQRSLLK